jgi:hypothetical protein
MSRYERAYGTDWTSLDREEAIDRAYALGVAAALEEYHPEELDRVREETDTAYDQSVVDLAFDEGRTDAEGADPDTDTRAGAVWSTLVAEADASADGGTGAGEGAIGGRDGLPGALGRVDALDRADPDGTERVRLPEFLRE